MAGLHVTRHTPMVSKFSLPNLFSARSLMLPHATIFARRNEPARIFLSPDITMFLVKLPHPQADSEQGARAQLYPAEIPGSHSQRWYFAGQRVQVEL